MVEQGEIEIPEEFPSEAANDDFEDIVDEVIEEDICEFDEEEWNEEEDGEGLASVGGENEDDDFFDASIGKLEEIIMSEVFVEQQEAFMRDHCAIFDRTAEMKFEYTDIFKQYTALIEDHIERALTEGVHNFSMDRFLTLLQCREEEVCADVFDMLLSLSDFEMFREQMCEYKEQRLNQGNQQQAAAASFLCISGNHSTIHEDEQEDGEARPELNASSRYKASRPPTRPCRALLKPRLVS